MVHVPAKFRENTSMRFWATVRKLNVTDRQTYIQTDRRGALQYLPSRAFGAAGDNIWSTKNSIMATSSYEWCIQKNECELQNVYYIYVVLDRVTGDICLGGRCIGCHNAHARSTCAEHVSEGSSMLGFEEWRRMLKWYYMCDSRK